jgi:hypothetical protein
MKFIPFFILFFALSCNNVATESRKGQKETLLPKISRIEFDTLKDWNLGWRLLEPVRVATNESDEEQLLSKLSEGQRSLYVFLDLNSQVTNGGFIQYYWNDYGKFVSELENGLTLIGDTTILKLVRRSEVEYRNNRSFFDRQKQKDDWEPLYDRLKSFDSLDNSYYKHQQGAMVLFEKYIRQHPEQFVTFTE